MPIAFSCECGKSFKVAEEYAGKRTKCTGCSTLLTVPELAREVEDEPKVDEDAAFDVLNEGPDPPPAARTWQSSSYDASPPPPKGRPVDNSAYASRALASLGTTDAPKEKAKKKEKYRDPYAPQEKSWSVHWGLVGGALAIVGGLLWLGLGLLAGYIYFYPFFLILGGLISIIKGFLNRE